MGGLKLKKGEKPRKGYVSIITSQGKEAVIPSEKPADLKTALDQIAEAVNDGIDLESVAAKEIHLQCKVCKYDLFVPMDEFVRVAKRTPYRCPRCNNHPELFALKWNPFQTLAAGFVTEQKRRGISNESMKGMIGRAHSSGLVGSVIKTEEDVRKLTESDDPADED